MERFFRCPGRAVTGRRRPLLVLWATRALEICLFACAGEVELALEVMQGGSPQGTRATRAR